MRKVLYITIMLVLVLLMQGCKNSKTDNLDKNSNNLNTLSKVKVTTTPTEKVNITSEPQNKDVIISTQEALTAIAKLAGIQKLYYLDTDSNTGYYTFVQSKPLDVKGTSTFWKVNPYNGDVYNMVDEVIFNLLNSSKNSSPNKHENKNVTNNTTVQEQKLEKVFEDKEGKPFDDRIKEILQDKADIITKNEQMTILDGYKVINVATGDLNLDGISDLAVVVEMSPGDMKGSRMLYVLICGLDGRYVVSHANRNIILGKQEGGIWGDPFEKVEISDNVLSVIEYGGSNFRWQYIDKFKYIDAKLTLIEARRLNYYTGTGNGYQTDCDYINKTVKFSSTSMTEENYKPKLIYFELLQSNMILFDSFDIGEIPVESEFYLLPSLGWYEYFQQKNMIDLRLSTNAALDSVKKFLNTDMEKVQFSWTAETKTNYSSLVFYTVPEYYYKSGKLKLYYYDLEDNVKDKLEHVIILSDENDNTTFYWVDDATGEVKKR